jgi:hypothetical protein
MKRLVLGAVMGFYGWSLSAQVTITSKDMFSGAGLYYRAYAHDTGTSPLAPNLYSAGNRMGSAGPDRFWDFSTGPTDQIQRYDYLSAEDVPEALDFPSATLVEQKTIEGGGDVEWLMFSQVPGLGRRVYGAVTEVSLLGRQPLIFSPAPIDFPDTIAYEDTWNNDFTFEASDIVGVDPEEPDVGYSFRIRQHYSQKFTVDAWGTVHLPNLGLLPVLRVNGEQTVTSEYYDDFINQGWQFVGTDHARVYYWLSPDHGIVAQLQSASFTSPAPENFDRALGFVRMFETNKEPGTGSSDPQPVGGLRVTVSNNLVLLQWDKSANTSRYRVEVATGGFGPADWQLVATETQNDYLFDPSGFGGTARFYRVVSVP